MKYRRRQLRLAIGFCERCGDEREGSARLCGGCAGAERARQNALRAERERTGLCTRCGGQRDDEGKRRCAACREALAAYQRGYTKRKGAEGRCARCGEASGGYRLCRRHRIVTSGYMRDYRAREAA